MDGGGGREGAAAATEATDVDGRVDCGVEKVTPEEGGKETPPSIVTRRGSTAGVPRTMEGEGFGRGGGGVASRVRRRSLRAVRSPGIEMGCPCSMVSEAGRRRRESECSRETSAKRRSARTTMQRLGEPCCHCLQKLKKGLHNLVNK